jgi:hypothetical protein
MLKPYKPTHSYHSLKVVVSIYPAGDDLHKNRTFSDGFWGIGNFTTIFPEAIGDCAEFCGIC